MPVPNESSISSGYFAERLDQLLRNDVSINEEHPPQPAPEPILRSSTVRIVPQHHLVHTIFSRAGRRELSAIDGTLEIIIDPFASTMQPSELAITTYGELRVISNVSAAHVIHTSSGVFEFEPVRGANITIRADMVIGAYRARRVEPASQETIRVEPEQKPAKKRGLLGL